MRHSPPEAAVAWVGVLAVTLSGCQQSDQELPFELDPTAAQSVTVNASGGVVSVPPNFSIQFFPGTLGGSEVVTAQKRVAAFPSDAGAVLPETAYDVGPAGTALSPAAPARVQIAVPSALLGAGDELSLVVALLQPGGTLVTDAKSYDIANGILTADVYELGPVAAVLAADALPLGDLADLPSLDGGAITPVSAPAAAQGSGAPRYPDGVQFSASCAPGERNCFTSGIAQVWVDDVARDRLGDELVLINTSVDASIEFFAFNPLTALPDSAIGYLLLDGDLRARINQVVSSREIGDEVAIYTGNGSDPNPDPTGISFAGGAITFEFTSQEAPEVIEFDVTGVGTSDLLTVQVEGYLEFENASGPPTRGDIVAHVRLRR